MPKKNEVYDPIMIHKITPSVDYNYTQLNEPTNHNANKYEMLL